MKKNSKKILIILMAIILIIGTVIISTKGLKFELKYQDSKKVEINLGKNFEIKDIKEITNEIFKEQTVEIQTIEIYKEAVSITTSEITEDQKAELVTKLNEKYGLELNVENIKIEENAHIRGRDIIKPYIIPFIVVTIIVMVCLLIRYNKLNKLKVLGKTATIIVVAQLVLLCIMAIIRIPIGIYTIPTVFLVYMLSTYICTTKFDKELEKKIAEEK